MLRRTTVGISLATITAAMLTASPASADDVV